MNEAVERGNITKCGFTVIDKVYSIDEIEEIVALINSSDKSKDTFRKSSDLFAIRQFLKEIPSVQSLIFNDKLKNIIHRIFGDDYFVVKSIYFDKPATSNWYVAYHQDLTISVNEKTDIENFGPWTIKHNQYAVQPPVEILENIFTIRIHLDQTDVYNGALKVLEASHLKGICRFGNIDLTKEKETVCRVPEGGVMIMRPLLFHSSNRTLNNKKRRVIHIEFSNLELPEDLNWAERLIV